MMALCAAVAHKVMVLPLHGVHAKHETHSKAA